MCTKYTHLIEVLLNSRMVCFSTHLHFLGGIFSFLEKNLRHIRVTGEYWKSEYHSMWDVLRSQTSISGSVFSSGLLHAKESHQDEKKITPGFVEQSFHFIREKCESKLQQNQKYYWCWQHGGLCSVTLTLPTYPYGFHFVATRPVAGSLM